MASINFKGKTTIWNHHLSVPYQTLDKVAELSYNTDKANGNLIVEGDNLTALKSLLPTYQGRIKCIYIDPPYNTGEESWTYNDRVNSPMIKEWLGKAVGKDDLTRHDKWLCMMTPRLKLLRDLLRDDGTIFISIDENEIHHCRMLLNEIFGEENFITLITWQRKKESSNDSKNISVKAEYLLVFSRTPLSQLHLLNLSEEYIESSYYDATDEFPKGKWRPVPIATTKGHKGGGYIYDIRTPSGAVHRKSWAYPEESYKKLLDNKLVYFGKDNSGIPQRVIYAHESEGIPASNIWNNIWDDIATNKQGKKEILEIFGDNSFDTPKPTQLIKKILELATDKDSIILDSFAGSGTTAHAVLEFNEMDNGNRKFILVQMKEDSESEPDKNICKDITRERIKRVIEQKLDNKYGFEYQRLGKLIDPEAMLEGDLPTYKEFAKYVYYLATGKSHDNEDQISEENYFVGSDGSLHIYLIYKQDYETLQTLALTLDKANEIKAKYNGHRKIVYAPACYMDEEYLKEFNIQFVSIPYNLFERIQK